MKLWQALQTGKRFKLKGQSGYFDPKDPDLDITMQSGDFGCSLGSSALEEEGWEVEPPRMFAYLWLNDGTPRFFDSNEPRSGYRRARWLDEHYGEDK
jgi:hypothetical protein